MKILLPSRPEDKMSRQERREMMAISKKLQTSIDMVQLLDEAAVRGGFKRLIGMLIHWYRQIEKNRKASPIKAATDLIEATDRIIKEDLGKDKALSARIACRKGCNHCCYTSVHILRGEAELLVAYAEQHAIKLDIDRLKRQADHDHTTWFSLPIEDRQCVMLSENGECGAYEARPSVCRKYFVLDDPETCNTVKFHGGRVMRVVCPEADAVLSAVMSFHEHGSMADMILKSLPK